MTNNDTLNTLVLAALLALVVGLGVYITQKKQPAELRLLEQEETALRMQQAEVADLLLEHAETREVADEAMRRWNSRYKILPQMVTSPSVVNYLNDLSREGFQAFDVTLGGVSRHQGYNTLSYHISGSGFFEALYRFIWEVENGRGLYRINDLTITEITHDEPNPLTEVPRRMQLVQFSMNLMAYFGGEDGLSSPNNEMAIPLDMLPPQATAGNPFFPLILADLPPNSDNLVDLENDELISVIGDVAVFRSSLGPRPVREGERVYLGRIVSVDAQRARVVAELNKGGIRERLEIELATGERYRQAIGRTQLVPLSTPITSRPSPPQPGTPEYRRLYDIHASENVQQAPELQHVRETADIEEEEVSEGSGRGVSVRPFPTPAPTTTDEPTP